MEDIDLGSLGPSIPDETTKKPKNNTKTICPICQKLKGHKHQRLCFKCDACGEFGYGNYHQKTCKAIPEEDRVGAMKTLKVKKPRSTIKPKTKKGRSLKTAKSKSKSKSAKKKHQLSSQPVVIEPPWTDSDDDFIVVVKKVPKKLEGNKENDFIPVVKKVPKKSEGNKEKKSRKKKVVCDVVSSTTEEVFHSVSAMDLPEVIVHVVDEHFLTANTTAEVLDDVLDVQEELDQQNVNEQFVAANTMAEPEQILAGNLYHRVFDESTPLTDPFNFSMVKVNQPSTSNTDEVFPQNEISDFYFAALNSQEVPISEPPIEVSINNLVYSPLIGPTIAGTVQLLVPQGGQQEVAEPIGEEGEVTQQVEDCLSGSGGTQENKPEEN